MRWRTGLLVAALGCCGVAIADPVWAAGSKRAKSAQSSKAKSSTARRTGKASKKGQPSKAGAEAPSGEAAGSSSGGSGSKPPAGKAQTYTFDAQEVEGRLRSPQILYFLRRVRAQFEPQPLGHRSFLMELQATQRHRVLR